MYIAYITNEDSEEQFLYPVIVGVGDTRAEALETPREIMDDVSEVRTVPCSVALAQAAVEEDGHTPWRKVDGVACCLWEHPGR